MWGTCGIIGITCLLYTNLRRQRSLIDGTEKKAFIAAELDDELYTLRQGSLVLKNWHSPNAEAKRSLVLGSSSIYDINTQK